MFNVNVHDPVEPIVNVVGLLVGDKVHEPVFDHVLTPGEFVVATFDRIFT
jgi:xanthosine utilization system XapX-like protein